MPRIGIVAGWAVYVYPGDHPRPHVHFKKSGVTIVMGIDGSVLHSDQRVFGDELRTVKDWIERHRDELRLAWDDVQAYKSPRRIPEE